MPIPLKTKKIIAHTGDQSSVSFRTQTNSIFTAKKGLNEQVIRELSRQKSEPKWMLEFRLQSYKIFLEKKMPTWGADLSTIDFDNIHYYVRPQDKTKRNWDDVPQEIKDTFEKLGVPEAERKFLAGSGALRITDDPSALAVREETILKEFPLTYQTLVDILRKRYKNFVTNPRFHSIRKPLVNHPKYCKTRYLDPINKKGGKKDYYSKKIIAEFDKHYKKKN